MCELSPVSFHGDTIFVIELNDQPFTPMKPIVENLGLDWATQFRKLNGNVKRWGIVIMTIPSESGEQETLCMPVRKLPAYLASINPNKVREALRAKIELYQNESDDALWNYWMNGRAERKVLTNPPCGQDAITPEQRATLLTIMRTKVDGMEPVNKGARMQMFASGWSRFNNHFCIARYCQLPQSKMGEAIAYLIKMELKPKAMEAEPAPASLPQWINSGREEQKLHPGSVYYQFLSEVEQWRCVNRQKFFMLLEKGAKLIDPNMTGSAIYESYVHLLRNWLEMMALSEYTAFPRPFTGNPAPAQLAAQLNAIFGSMIIK